VSLFNEIICLPFLRTDSTSIWWFATCTRLLSLVYLTFTMSVYTECLLSSYLTVAWMISLG
jgi:hypothetical protein